MRIITLTDELRGVSDNETQLLNDLRDANLSRSTDICYLTDKFNYADVSFLSNFLCAEEKIWGAKIFLCRFFSVFSLMGVEILSDYFFPVTTF